MSATSDWTQTKGRAREGKYGCRPDPAILDCHHRRFEGVRGAVAILNQLESSHSRLDVADNNLGTAGIKRLLAGLEDYKAKFATSASAEGECWELDTLEVADCNLTDEGMKAVMDYALREPMLRSLIAGSNPLQLKGHLDHFAKMLNALHIKWLDLCSSKRLPSSSVSHFFTLLDAPHLSSLDLSFCSLQSDVVGSIVGYLQSPRSRTLTRLELQGNHFDTEATRAIVDALEFGNLTMLHFNLRPDARRSMDMGRWHVWLPPKSQLLEGELPCETDRIGPLLQRNVALIKRTRTAALRCLAAARILLNAEPLTPLEQSSTLFTSTAPEVTPTTHHPPLPTHGYLHLPLEIKHLIVRHTSQDAGALSNAQFARLRQYAEGKDGMARALRARAWMAKDSEAERAKRRYVRPASLVESSLADGWLRSERLDVWESNS